MNKAARHAWIMVVLAAAAMGCSAAEQLLLMPRLRECDGFDAPLSILATSSRKELRVRVQGRGVDHDFPFVVESDADSIVLVAFTPLGTKAFTLERHVDDTTVESMVGPALPVAPRNVMADLLAMSVPSACAGGSDPTATATVGVWKLVDTCGDGRPVHRRISREESGPEVDVEYTSDAILVRQYKCRYTARYVLHSAAVTPPSQSGEAGGAEAGK